MLAIYPQPLPGFFIAPPVGPSAELLLIFHCRSTRSPTRLYSLLSLFNHCCKLFWLSAYSEKSITCFSVVFDSLCWSLVAYQNIFLDPYVSLSLCMHSNIICRWVQRDICIPSTLIFVLLYIIQLFLRNPHGKPRKSQNFTLRGARTLNGRDWCPKAEIGNIQRAESRNRNPSCCKLSSFLAIIVDWNSQGHPFIL
mgnify:FL=1